MGTYNPREDVLRMYRRQGYEQAQVSMNLCPSLGEEFLRRHGHKDYAETFQFPLRGLTDPGFSWNFEEAWRIPDRPRDWSAYYPGGFEHPVKFDGWGIAHEAYPNTQHMTRMHYPLEHAETLAEFKSYPWPDFERLDFSYLKPQVESIQRRNLAVVLTAECTIWEIAWYLRSMDAVFCDMAMESELAHFLFDKITDLACFRVRKFAEAGVDILNPVQPECMDFAEIHAEFGDRLSFNGTLGTQQLMPFGTPEQIKAEVHRNLTIAGKQGGLFCCPTHMLEPEVPWENILAYVEAVREFR